MSQDAEVRASADPTTEPEAASTETPRPARRRRRGGRGRRKPTGQTTAAADGAGRVGAEEGVGPETAVTETAVAEPTDAAVASDADAETAADGDAAAPKKKRRRGRRGGRGRRKTTTAADTGDAADEAPADATAETQRDDAEPDAQAETRPRRRRRSRGSGSAIPATETAPEPERPKQTKTDSEIVAAGGPTRLRSSRTRTRTTTTRRRREPAPVVPRVTDKLMVITEHGERDQIAVLEGPDLVQHYVTRVGAQSMVGNIYLGRVQNVLPGMEAAFVDVGRGRNGVLYAGEVNYSPEDLEGAPPRIEHVLKSGQAVMVQVTKDPMGGKGARLTAQVSIPGRYLVMVPEADVSGISRRIPDAERRRLKALLKKVKPPEHGVIVRTAAEGAPEEAVAADLARLVREWDGIQRRAKRSKAPAVLYEEPELTVRVVRDLFTDEEFRGLVTDSRRVYDLVTEYVRDVAPDLAEKVRFHEGPLSALEEHHVVEQIHKALDRKVWLPSGGYLVIERTEAMTIIDVNTGKSVGKRNLEETVVNTNLEAAREAARQLRLRDIGGIIVIDFIDMLLEQNKRKVEDTMREALAVDKTRSQVFEIGPLGLMQVTRKRVSSGLVESFSETCPHCEGRGIILNYSVG